MGDEKDKNDEERGVGVLGGVRIMSDMIERRGINEVGRGVLVLRGVGRMSEEEYDKKSIERRGESRMRRMSEEEYYKRRRER
jgi:hypothetical protein